MNKTILRFENISTNISENMNLNNLNFMINSGESTFIFFKNTVEREIFLKLFLDASVRYDGNIYFYNKKIILSNLLKSKNSQIAIVSNNTPPSIHALSVYQNLILGQERFFLRIPKSEFRQKFSNLCEKYGISVDLKGPVSLLSLQDRIILGIIRAIMLNSKLIVLDKIIFSLPSMQLQHVITCTKKLICMDNGALIFCLQQVIPSLYSPSDRIIYIQDGQCIFNRYYSANLMSQLISFTYSSNNLTIASPSQASKKRINCVRDSLNIFHISFYSRNATQVKKFLLEEGQCIGLYLIADPQKKQVNSDIHTKDFSEHCFFL